MMKRQSSSTSLLLLDPDFDNSDVFDPPAWRPGRFLQFADISLEDEPNIRPVSLYTERTVLGAEESTEGSSSDLSSSSAFVVQVDPSHQSPRYLRLSRRTAVAMTSCVAVALTALTFLTFVLSQ